MSFARTNFWAKSKELLMFCSAKFITFCPTSLALVWAVLACVSSVTAVLCAADRKPSTAFFACSTLCSANWRICVGTSKFHIGSLAILVSSGDVRDRLSRGVIYDAKRLICNAPRSSPFPALSLSAHAGALRRSRRGRGKGRVLRVCLRCHSAFADPNDCIRESRYDPCAHARRAALPLCDERDAGVAVGIRRNLRNMGKRGRRSSARRSDPGGTHGANFPARRTGCGRRGTARGHAAAERRAAARTGARHRQQPRVHLLARRAGR